jgi:hypothetical protein
VNRWFVRRELEVFAHFDAVIGIVARMANQLVVLAVKAIAAIYGLLTLAIAILYSVSRPDTWKSTTEDERRALEKGTQPSFHRADGAIELTSLLHHSMQKALVPLRTRR